MRVLNSVSFIADHEIRTRINEGRIVCIEHVLGPVLLLDVDAFRISKDNEKLVETKLISESQFTLYVLLTVPRPSSLKFSSFAASC